MYTILINKNNTLTTSNRTNIMHRSSMVDSLRVLVDPYYDFNDTTTLDMSEFICTMEYVLPVSRKYTTEVLTPQSELYKEKLDYRLPVDTKITSEAGDVEVKFIFTKLEMLDEGTMKPRVRKTSSTIVKIIPVETWSDYIPDANLDSIAQMMLMLQGKIEQEKAYAEIIATTKADGIAKDEETNEIYLTAYGQEIGNRIKDSDTCTAEDGVPVVEFTTIEPENPDDGSVDNVVEF